MTRLVACVAAFMLLGAKAAPSPTPCTFVQSGHFANDPARERVVLWQPPGGDAGSRVGLFSAPLAVDTDGAAKAYHPDDELGARLALTQLRDGIVIYDAKTRKRVDHLTWSRVYSSWKASGYTAQPGYRIVWNNAIAAGPDGKPCIFRQQANPVGYFGSLSSLKNGISPAKAGECARLDQVDLTAVPAIALRGGGSNPLFQYGARKGDLVIAINPHSGVVVPAIIADTGDTARIGEGSVALNMRLLGVATPPVTNPQANRLDTGAKKMLIAVLPGTRGFRTATPFDASNVAARVNAWIGDHHLGTLATLADEFKRCGAQL